jgi:hypothetical protein
MSVLTAEAPSAKLQASDLSDASDSALGGTIALAPGFSWTSRPALACQTVLNTDPAFSIVGNQQYQFLDIGKLVRIDRHGKVVDASSQNRRGPKSKPLPTAGVKSPLQCAGINLH